MAEKPRGTGRRRGGRAYAERVDPPVELVDPAEDLVGLVGPVDLKERLARQRVAVLRAAPRAIKTNPGTVFLRSQAARSKARSVQIAPATAFCASRV